MIYSLLTAWKSGIRFFIEAGDFSFLHSTKTGSGAHSAFCPKGIGLFPLG
jgi:hypothetical protein